MKTAAPVQDKLVVLTGPRQSGKTTLLLRLFGECHSRGYAFREVRGLGANDAVKPAAEPPRGKRNLKINLVDLQAAFENASPEHSYYLDLETGSVVLVSHEARGKLDQIYEEVGDEGDGGRSAFSAALERLDIPDWMKEEVEIADQVEEGFGSRYIRVASDDSHQAYGDMEDFVEKVTDERVRSRLWSAIRSPRPFRRFKDTLADYPRDRERWFAFKEERLRQRMLAWLREEGIGLFGGSPAP